MVSKSRRAGDADAQYGLSVCYYNGRGVARDCVEARKLCEKAAAQGHEDAIDALSKWAVES